ncbi:MAG: EAL domain-containing protein, partial [Mycobacteriaceae bacterium]
MSDKISALRSLKDPVDWPSLLRSALTGEGVASAYQPIVDITRATVVGYEALARFPGYPISDPERWFDAAERHGCGAALQAVALRCALAERTALPPNCFLSVNIGPEVLSSPKVREVWGDVGDMSGVIVELTEHTRIDSYGELQADFARLRAAGALLAVDDVGSGYAGLTHLLALRPEMIKLDRALIDGIDRDEAKRGLVEMI